MPEELSNILPILIPAAIALVVLVVIVLIMKSMIKIASGNEVLVVTGIGATKRMAKQVKVVRGATEVTEEQITYEPKIKIAGAAIVIPFIQRAKCFDICVKKSKKDDDLMKTRTGVEIVIDWSIAYAPNAESIESLQPCIRQFLDKNAEETEDIVMSSVAGGMRAVISTMTPQEVMVGKETLDEAVQKNIAAQMAELGYKVQIFIQEVRDAKGGSYYHDLAAEDREQTRQNAAAITAAANQTIREKNAEAERVAKQAELDSDVAIAARERDADLQRAAFQIEVDKAKADADIAGKLQASERARELAEKEGAVEVMRQTQADLAAKAEQAVTLTRADTAKQATIIAAQGEAERQRIEASAKATIAETEATGQAKAAIAKASGEADAAKTKATGEAEAIKQQASAEAERIRVTGEAEATAISAKGKAEAEAIAAKGKAEAEAALALSEAQAANDGVNFELAKLKVEYEAQVQVATNVAQAMARVGEKATFYDFGGHTGSGDGSDLLTRIMSNMPKLFAQANLQNQALNGKPLSGSIEEMIGSLAGPIGEALSKAKLGATDTLDASEAPSANSTPTAEAPGTDLDSTAEVAGGEADPPAQDIADPATAAPAPGKAHRRPKSAAPGQSPEPNQ